MTALLAVAHGQNESNAVRPAFEVASIKPGDPHGLMRVTASGTRFSDRNTYLTSLIQYAYHLQLWQIPNRPGCFDSDRFVIEAIKPAGSKIGLTRFQDEELKSMVRTLLEDRFKLVLHRESKEGVVYALVVAKSGAKLREAADTPDANEFIGASVARGTQGLTLEGKSATASDIAFALSGILERPVLDETSLKGHYDFTMEYSGGMETDGPSIFASLQQQLGLRLEARKGPVTVVVIEHAEKPSYN
ncbi:MAG: TIGR03435 family protein [Bryobacteraceae bacterium]